MATKFISDFLPHSKMREWLNHSRPLARTFLSSAQCEGPDLPTLLQMALPEHRKRFENLALCQYANSQGDIELRQTIANFYPGLGAENIVTFAGAQEALTCAFFALATNQMEVVTTTPCFPPLHLVPTAVAAKITQVPLLDGPFGWALDLPRFLNSIKSGLIVLNFPHNPTGHIISRAELDAIIACAQTLDCAILSDEVFSGLDFSEASAALAPVASLYVKGVSIGTVSKSLGLSGVRIGWLASQDVQFVERVLKVKSYCSICTGVSDEILALIALTNHRQIQNDLMQTIKSNLHNAQALLLHATKSLSFHAPLAGPFVFAKLNSQMTARDLANTALSAGIQILPGDIFGDYPQHFRLGLGLKNFNEPFAQLLRLIS